MARSDDAGTAWASSYDERASEVLGAANDLVKALENYGGVINQAVTTTLLHIIFRRPAADAYARTDAGSAARIDDAGSAP